MIALAAAVMPIIRLLVAVATRSGTPIAEVHQRHLDDPAADAEQGRDDAGARRADDPAPEVADAVARRRTSRSSVASVAAPRPASPAGVAGASGRRLGARRAARAIVTAT